MKRTVFSSILVIGLTIPAALGCDGPPVCTVTDPTSTALNVRQGPNGTILSTLRDGMKVEIIEHQEADGQTWALIANFGASWGYVFADYVVCDGEDEFGEICTVTDPTGTPLNIRVEPNGEILGNWANGTRIRPYDTVTFDGKQWLAVERWADDNAVGWVFDPYLTCEEDEHA
ncbi:MAG: hypothetical protein JWR75_699 [Devosia sp.]|nr:hypothetical protein [Devosia sp.]